jgi:hypothetical protein
VQAERIDVSGQQSTACRRDEIPVADHVVTVRGHADEEFPFLTPDVRSEHRTCLPRRGRRREHPVPDRRKTRWCGRGLGDMPSGARTEDEVP